MINQVILIGRLTRDPEIKSFGDSQVANFTLAVDRDFKNKNGEREADFIPVVAWRQTAALIGQYLHKGNLCAVTGRIQTRNYEDNNHVKHYITEVLCDQIQFLSPRDQNQSGGYNQGYGNNSGYSNPGYQQPTNQGGFPNGGFGTDFGVGKGFDDGFDSDDFPF